LSGLIPQALREHVAFEPYRAQENIVARMLASGFPSAAQSGAVNLRDGLREPGCKHPGYGAGGDRAVPNFIPPPARHLSAIEFERRVVEQNELVVRPDNLHDVLNALVWLTFPKTKRAISEAHVALGVTADGKTRPRRRDVLTLFDESGILILSENDNLRTMNQQHQWRELFVVHRNDFIQQARPILFGHGAMEQLGKQLPQVHRGLTAKALWLPLPADTTLPALDAYLSARIVDGESLGEQERSTPMPVLGLPGWFAENESPDCYDDEAVFRPRRAGSLS
jgi:hypothetical protein